MLLDGNGVAGQIVSWQLQGFQLAITHQYHPVRVDLVNIRPARHLGTHPVEFFLARGVRDDRHGLALVAVGENTPQYQLEGRLGGIDGGIRHHGLLRPRLTEQV